ncbi:MAG: YeiH family protein, partial [Archangium sp.]
TVSLGGDFLLNGVALVIFPPIGHALGMTEAQFGLWSALAIHDTSSVVGASMQYGAEALALATTVKLARALWIIPVTAVLARVVPHDGGTTKRSYPWFIVAFVAMAALVTFVPALTGPGKQLAAFAKWALVASLFFVGLGVSKEALKQVGVKPLVLGVVLWVLVSAGTLAAILTTSA